MTPHHPSMSDEALSITEPTEEELNLVELIDSVLSAGNPQSAFAYPKVSAMIQAHVAARNAAAERVLREIADEDYRGNRSPASNKAHTYLQSVGRRHVT